MRSDYMEFKAGDIIKVKDCLMAGETYGNHMFIGVMEKYKNVIDTIVCKANCGYLLNN